MLSSPAAIDQPCTNPSPWLRTAYPAPAPGARPDPSIARDDLFRGKASEPLVMMPGVEHVHIAGETAAAVVTVTSSSRDAPETLKALPAAVLNLALDFRNESSTPSDQNLLSC